MSQVSFPHCAFCDATQGVQLYFASPNRRESEILQMPYQIDHQEWLTLLNPNLWINKSPS
jgi:galactose-1-phosphate uridylyltransferase